MFVVLILEMFSGWSKFQYWIRYPEMGPFLSLERGSVQFNEKEVGLLCVTLISAGGPEGATEV